MAECYNLAFHHILDHGENDKSMRLCHGIPKGQGGEAQGLRYGHAWIEFDMRAIAGGARHAFVIDLVANVIVPRDRYYKLGDIDTTQVRRYTRQQAIKNALKYENLGPWALHIKKAHHLKG